jgi:hypothetical protein
LYRSKIEKAKAKKGHESLFNKDKKKKKRKAAPKTSPQSTGASPRRKLQRQSSAALTPSQTQLKHKKYRLIKLSETLMGTECYQLLKTGDKTKFAPIKITSVPAKPKSRSSVTVDAGNGDNPDSPYDGTNTLKVKIKDLRMLVDMIEEAGSEVDSSDVDTPPHPKSSSGDASSGSESEEDDTTGTQGDGDQSKSREKNK